MDQRFRYRSEGSLMRSEAQALVTWVKAKLRHSRLPNDPELSILAKSASVDLEGRVSLRGPPFCCCEEIIKIRSGQEVIQWSLWAGHTNSLS